MRIELRAFQLIAAESILGEMAEARESISRGKVQAVVLSAPTGSGKTITTASVIDQTFGGGDGVVARPDTVFLWLSDSPELNTQSKNKLLNTCDNVPFHKMVTIDSDFDEELLHPGHVYFINTQLLGRDKRLTTQPGDERQFPFWQTVANTVARRPLDFVLIIDEAHRGATADRNRTPIMQKFILGSESDGMPAVPLVLGMSATPQRFTELLGNTTRTLRPVVITAEDVRSSGLIKDIIIVHNPKNSVPGDLTMLELAAERWKTFTTLWTNYCQKENEKEFVRPILVVQVEDGNARTLTRTPIANAIRAIERHTGALAVNEIVHCFQDQTDIEAAGRIIRKVEASRIQESPDVKVVLFKTALSTGWDCPRAEIMMSFRRAQDPTSIAQLVGRMVRTPLARRIKTNEVLDTVELFLPHYDAEALEHVLSKLRKPEAEEGIATRVETATEEYPRNLVFAGIFDYSKHLPTYFVNRAPKLSELKRLLRLAGTLVHDGVDKEADDEVRTMLTGKLKELRDHYAHSDPSWRDIVRDEGEIEVDVNIVSVGPMNVTDKREMRLTLTEANIDQLFDACGRRLAAGEGLHRSYWKRYHDHEKPNEAKLELFAVVRQPGVLEQMERLAAGEFSVLWKKHKTAIQALPAVERARFETLIQASGKPVQHDWDLPEEIVERKAGDSWTKHLFCNAKGQYFCELNSWERELLDQAMKEEGFVGWLRNLPRREWALCIPYELGGTKPFYPDFIIVRQKGNTFEVDVLEPHDHSRSDAWAKAKGLATFADLHGMEFGRLIFARKHNNEFQKLDMNDKDTRRRARNMQSQNELEALFEN